MDYSVQQLHNNVNKAIIKCRGVYSAWSKKHNISYNRMLVIYTIREYGYCCQKQMCDNYLLPRQTMNNVITAMRNEGLLSVSDAYTKGREKAFVLTPKGIEYSKPFLDSINTFEQTAAEKMGIEKILAMTELVMEYDRVLAESLEETL